MPPSTSPGARSPWRSSPVVAMSSSSPRSLGTPSVCHPLLQLLVPESLRPSSQHWLLWQQLRTTACLSPLVAAMRLHRCPRPSCTVPGSGLTKASPGMSSGWHSSTTFRNADHLRPPNMSSPSQDQVPWCLPAEAAPWAPCTPGKAPDSLTSVPEYHRCPWRCTQCGKGRKRLRSQKYSAPGPDWTH